MAGAKNHDYHILPPSAWPLIGAIAALVLTSGGVMWMHSAPGGTFVLLAGFVGVLFTMFSWWADVIREAHAGDHTPVVQLHLRYGMILFIASEVMFFVGWFWAYFDFALFPAPIEWSDGAATVLQNVTAGAWPPKGIEVINAFELPLLNDTSWDSPRIGIAACGAGKGWRQAALMLTSDGGASWQPLGNGAPAAVMGRIITPAPSASGLAS